MSVEQALRKAFSLGQTYWLQADSDSPRHWAKSDATRAVFEELVLSTVEPDPRPVWAALMRGVRVEGNTVVISTRDNEVARVLCAALIEEMNK